MHTTAYGPLPAWNTAVSTVRRGLGYPHWSLSAFLKHRTRTAVDYLGRFETVLCDEARRQAVDGVICGHMHIAKFKNIQGFSYIDDGGWEESCTNLVERHDGILEILCMADETVRTGPDALQRDKMAAT